MMNMHHDVHDDVNGHDDGHVHKFFKNGFYILPLDRAWVHS